MPLLEIKNLYKTFDQKSLSTVDHISFDVDEAEFISIIGPSGTGKSTVVKMILGLVPALSGEIFYKSELLMSPGFSNKELLNDFSYVSQELSLDPELTIFDNIAGCLNGPEESIIHHKVRNVIEVFGLQYKDHKFPNELSTGQKKRVELAKAMVTEPKVIILDEPFSNLDRNLRFEIKEELLEILRERDITCIMVTHDLEDAFSYSDRILLLADGIIKQFSSAYDLFYKPENAYVAKFMGDVNLVAGSLRKVGEALFHKSIFGDVQSHFFSTGEDDSKFAYLVFRPDDISLSSQGAEGSFAGKITKVLFKGSHQDIFIRFADKQFIFRDYEIEPLVIGEGFSFCINFEKAYLISI